LNKTLSLLALCVLLGACAAPTSRPVKIDERIAAELNQAVEQRPKPVDDAQIKEALLPPLRAQMPEVTGVRLIEPKFDLVVNNAPAPQVFMSIVSGTRYSMLVHPSVSGTVSVNLKDVTVREALDSMRDLYGYEYRIDGTRILIEPLTIQTRIFHVNYLVGQRVGRSDIRVTSGSVSDAPAGATPAGPANAAAGGTGGAGGASNDSSRVQTQTRSDFWEDLTRTLQAIVGAEGGRSVVINPQAGVVMVRALPLELRNVDKYLRAIKLSVERQVMLEAKIIEVTLNEQFQSGVNWSLFSNSRNAIGGLLNPNTSLGASGAMSTPAGPTLSPGTLAANTSAAALATAGVTGTLLSGTPGGSLLGLAFQTQNFAALLQFLESQGSVQVLSSPRIATMNNQKAVLKVGTDEFFLTGISGGTTGATGATGTGATNTFPTLTVRPFFSGVALDVTPQIDEGSNIILHIHPSVSNVQQDNRQINLGATFGGSVTLPLARSTVSESDSIVKVGDSNIVAIGGLMKVDYGDERSGIPGAQDLPGVGAAFRTTSRVAVKKELVILIKPTVVRSSEDLMDGAREMRDRLQAYGEPATGSASGR